MTERQGLFTVQTAIFLTPANRARLERLVREQRSDPADVVTRIVSARPLDALPKGVERDSDEAVPVRVYLTPEQRAAFTEHLAATKLELAELVTQVVAEHLATLPEAPVEARPTPQVDLSRRRTELARLKARRDNAGAQAPAWLSSYIAELEAELRQLERAV